MTTDPITRGINRFVKFFETLDRNRLSEIRNIYSINARFIDPFNDVKGVEAIENVFQDMYKRCRAVEFTVDESVVQGETAYVRWRFGYSTKIPPNDEKLIEGVSRLVFEDNGLVREHTDYWDAARQIYEPLPVIGAILRYLRKRIGAGAG